MTGMRLVMGNLFASLNTGVSGLHTAQSSLYTAAHNLSNATTPGHTRQQVMVTDYNYTTRQGVYGNLMQVGLGSNVAVIRQIRNTFLDAQYRVQVGRESFYDAQYKALSEIEDMFGEMEGEEFSKVMNEGLWKALSDLQENPDQIVFRSEMVAMASKFVDRANVIQTQLLEYQKNMNEEVIKQVNSINNIVSEIKQYNSLIHKFEATGERANDYRDARNLLLDELGSYINFDSVEEVDGSVSIFAEGRYLLETNVQFELTTAYESDESRLLKPVWDMGKEDFFQRGELSYSVEDNSDTGSLRGLLVARGTNLANYTHLPQRPMEKNFVDEDGNLDEAAYLQATIQYEEQVEEFNKLVQPSIVMTVQSQFDCLIHGIVTMINDTFCPNKEVTAKITQPDGTQVTKTIHILDTEKSGVGDDADETMGTEIFVRRNTPRYTKTNVTIINDDGTETTQEVYMYNEEDPSDPYTLYTIGQLEVNPELLRDPSKLPLNSNPLSGNADSFAWDLCEQMMSKWNEDFGTLDPNSKATYTYKNYYEGLVGQFAVQGNVWRDIVENQERTVYSVEQERQRIMGVSSDEELSDLIKFQQCFNASSRYITVVDEMIEHLITHL